MKWGRPRGRWLLAGYGALLFASHFFQTARDELPELGPGLSEVFLPVVGGEEGSPPIRIAYRDVAPFAAKESETAIVLVHGSPGSLRDFDALAHRLASRVRVIAPDLPGFGRSERDLPDYSILAHAHYVVSLLERLGITRAHLVGFSLGGGVVLHAQELAPERMASVAFVASIGVQEMELLGSYEINHAIHGLQLGFLWVLQNATPHFGAFDGALGIPYARNFYDTDQRPLRGLLRRLELPMLIVHGRGDPLVPYAAAEEHARLVPQAELVTFGDRGHFLLWQEPAEVARAVLDFVDRVESGDAPDRARASEDRLAAAAIPHSEIDVAPAHGIGLVVLIALIVVGTFVSEDLTCVATGLLIAQNRLEWTTGIGACFAGIFFGDLLLYGAGRAFGRTVLRRAPWKWIVSEGALRRAAKWFERRGMVVVFLTRFLPGTRLPTYLAAGALRAKFLRFAFFFFVAVAVWTPALVALSAVAGQGALDLLDRIGRRSLVTLAATAVLFWLGVHWILPLSSWTGRRLVLGRWRRLTRWEFWPTPLFYLPVAAYVALLALRHRSLALVTAVNPGMPEGGFLGESKFEILRSLSGSAEWVARSELLPSVDSVDARIERLRTFLERESLGYPVVLKPDVGERGRGVVFVSRESAARSVLEESSVDLVVQERLDGPEFGVFYVREPGSGEGRIYSVTRKVLPVVTGNGTSTLEQLILGDERAVCMAETHLARHAERLDSIPAAGEKIELVEIGTHCRGAVFLDGSDLVTPALTEAIDEVSRRVPGFHFGRYDLRVSSEDELRAGRGFKILELNGMTSEATHIYDPEHSLARAWRVLFEQWRLAFAIAAENRRDGASPATYGAIWRRLTDRFRASPHDSRPKPS